MSDWQAIESAPMDGTQVIVYQPAEAPRGGVGQPRRHRVVIAVWRGYWYVPGGLTSVRLPTHWMPLPAPPETP
jgi:hypothetical protein